MTSHQSDRTRPDLAERVVRLVWENDPDLALEAGRLPPVAWEDVSAAHRSTAGEEAETLLGELTAAAGDPLSDAARYHLAGARSSIARFGIGVLNHMTGPVARLSWATDSWPLGADPAAEFYLERLRAFPSYCAALAAEIGSSPVASRPVIEAFVAQVDTFGAAHRNGGGPLTRPVAQVGRALPPGVLNGALDGLATLRSRAVAALSSAVPASPLPHLADGADRYAEAAYRGVSLTMTPRELEDLGRSILDASQHRFDELRTDGQGTDTPMSTGAEFLQRTEEFHARLTAALPRVCAVLPQMPCNVVPMPEAHAAVGPVAYYGPSSRQSDRPGSLYVNTAEPVTARRWEVLPLTMHEGVPGHHLQIALLDENESIPKLLRVLPVNAFTEGWAVYSETLAPQLGLAVEPADEFGLLAHQRWRAARLVTDVALHVRGCSVENAVDFMADQTRQDPRAVRREVVRYLAWPGQALGYAVGATVIASWVARRRAAGVSVADAHAELLRLGSVPLSVLAEAAPSA